MAEWLVFSAFSASGKLLREFLAAGFHGKLDPLGCHCVVVGRKDAVGKKENQQTWILFV